MGLTMKERKAVSKTLCGRYRRASKKEKGAILEQFVALTGYNRCYARRLLRVHGRQVDADAVLEGGARARKAKPRQPVYGPEVAKALEKVWKTLDYVCGKRLHAALPHVVPILVAHKELRASKKTVELLLQASPATLDRLLAPARKRTQLRARHATKPGTLLKQQIPVRTFADWDGRKPGFTEIDLVAHCGGNGRGDFCSTLDIVDVATGWTEQAAVKNKAHVWVFEAIKALRRRLPFALLGIDSDNGGEFINNALRNYCEENNITFTRSRPYRKNDTCHIEQKNWSVVRRAVGYARYEGEQPLQTLNQLYERLRLLNNFFVPSQKLVEKTRDGARVTRRHDKAKTPYHRLLESPDVPPAAKRALTLQYKKLNPAQLQREITALQDKLRKLGVRPPQPSQSATTTVAPQP